MSKITTAVILAAGKARRMGAIANKIPKFMVPVPNKPLINHQLEYLESVGIEKVFVIINKEHLPYIDSVKRKFSIKIDPIFQEKALGIAYALSLAENYVNSRFMVLLGDIFLKGKKGPIELEGDNIVGVIGEKDTDAIKKNFVVYTNKSGFVEKVIENPTSVTKQALKGIGIYVFNKEIFTAIKKTNKSKLRNEYELTDAIQVMINSGVKVRTFYPVIYEININNLSDLERCKKL